MSELQRCKGGWAHQGSNVTIPEAEERGNVDRDGANGGPKGKKRQKKAVQEEPPQDAKVRINSVTSPETILVFYFQENQESTPPTVLTKMVKLLRIISRPGGKLFKG